MQTKVQTLEDFESAPNYVDMVHDHVNDPEWLTAGDHPLTDAEQTRIQDMIQDYKNSHALAGDVQIADILAS